MSFPTRFSVTTFNVWGSNHWPARSTALVQSLLTMRSDIFLFQEVTPAIIECLDNNLLNYKRVKNENQEGWLKESNIYWNNDIFDLIDSGYGDLEMMDHPLRGIFWVRLAFKHDPSKKIFCSTAHYPWVGCNAEIETGTNQRVIAAVKTCEHLRRLVAFNEPAIFAGDLNEDFHPIRILSEECAYADVFESLDLPPCITHPVRPSDPMEEMRPNRTLDWILCNLPSNCRAIAAYVKGIRSGSYPPVSDHLPVTAVIEIL